MYLFPFNSYNQICRTLPLIVFQTKISLARDPRGIEMGLGIVSSLPDTTPTNRTKRASVGGCSGRIRFPTLTGTTYASEAPEFTPGFQT
jgi:hypothetical protein